MEQQLLKYFDVIGGLSIHPLVVHLFAVLTTLVSLVTLWQLARNRRGLWNRLSLLGGIAFVGLFVAVLSGEALATRVGYEDIKALGHNKYADLLLILACAQFILLLVIRWWDSRRRRSAQWVRPLTIFVLGIVAALTVAAAGMAVYTGERAVWSGEIAHTTFGDHSDN